MKDKMLAFLDSHDYCTISTVNAAGKPEAAFVAFSRDGLNMIIGTSNQSRKFQNLVANPSVAVVVADEAGEIQYEGKATIIDQDDDSEVENQHIAKLPGSDKYRNDPFQQYVSITPTWIRYIEHAELDQVEEFTEF